MSRSRASTGSAASSSRSSPAAVASSRSRGPSTNRPCRSRRDQPVVLEGGGQPVRGRPGQPGGGDEGGQAGRAGLERPKHDGGLVQDADSARVVHVPILPSQPPRRKYAPVSQGEHRGAHAGREGLGGPRRATRRGRARPALHRPAPGARGDQPAGLRRAAARRPPGPASRPHHRHRGPQRPDHRHRPADRRPGLAHPGRHAAPQLRRVRRAAVPAGRPRAGHRARRRPAARPHPARDDRRLRRLAHLDPRRVRLRSPSASAPARSSTCSPPRPCRSSRSRRWRSRSTATLRAGRHRQGPDPRGDRRDRHRRRPGLRHRVPRRGDPRAVDGGPDDHLQHVHRGRRPGRHDRAGRDDLRLPRGPAARTAGRRLGRPRSRPGASCAPTTTRSSTARSSSTRQRWRRSSPGAPTPGRACR